MRYNQPLGIPDTDAPYIDGNPPAGIRGSIIPAPAVEHPQREIVYAVEDAGLTPNFEDLTQLAQAIRRSTFIYAVDGGSVNNVVIYPIKAPDSYTAGLAYEVKVAATNTGATTISVSGLPPRALIRMNGQPLVAGDLFAGGIALIVYDGVQFQLLTSANQFIAEAALVHYGVDVGATNALVATVTPGISAYTAGLLCEIAVSHTNTGASTINLNGKGVKSIVRANGAALSAGDLLVGGLALIGYDGTSFQLYNVQVAPSTPGGTTDQSITGPLRPYFIAVNSATQTAPPSSPSIGDTYLVPPTGSTGAWSGLGGQLSQWTGADGWHTRSMPTQHMVGTADTDDFFKHMPDGSWRSIFATVAECEAGTSTTLAVTPKGLRRSTTITGPLRPYFIQVISRTTTSPPISPTEGDTYMVPSTGATGAWSGHGNEVTQWDGSAWIFQAYPATSMLGIGDTDDWWKTGAGSGRSAYASLQECRAGLSTVTIVNPAGLAFALAQIPDDQDSEIFFMGCFITRDGVF